ncbi:M20 family metallopeptidase [Mesorhizobium sp. M0184]|uniref:M20 family metallopeptidase n=1 Tax=Mesorhizobium sp. M0184 TaxID=2956906 RepID=UPI003337F913
MTSQLTAERLGTALDNVERDAIVELRQAMHREPELSNCEWKTQARIRDILERRGLDGAITFHETGLYVDILGQANGVSRSIAVRGDIDALPIQETRDDVPFRSQVPGVMHACGHDIHASVALGTALALHRQRNRFSGRVRVFFHPAEEAEPVGGRSVLSQRLLEGFDHAIGIHINPNLPVGVFNALPGAVSKSADQFSITFIGEMAHGAMPHKGVDAITIAAAFICEVQKVVSREFPVQDATVITIGKIKGGEAANIICPEVTIEGTIRTRTRERREKINKRVADLAHGLAALHNGRARVEQISGEPAVINDPGLVARFQQIVVEAEGQAALSTDPQEESSDDFGYYSETVPSLYFWFGSREPGNESFLHTPTFGASDELLAPTTDAVVRLCLDVLADVPRTGWNSQGNTSRCIGGVF